MADATEITIGGVTLTQFAFVRAGLADGLPLEELLRFLRLEPAAWAPAEEAWDERILDAVGEVDVDLLERLDAKTAEARTHWTRRVSPLDEDLRGWFAFLHAWKSDPEPVDFLRRMGVGTSDMAYLHRLWSDRISKDAKLREDALAMLRDEPGKPPVPIPERPRLRALRASSGGKSVTADIPFKKGQTLPFGEGEAAPMPPPLAVPLPRRVRPRATVAGVDETRQGGAAPASAALPFAPPADGTGSSGASADASPEGAAHLPEIPQPVGQAPAPPALVISDVPRSSDADSDADLDRTMAIDTRCGTTIPLSDAFEQLPSLTDGPMLTLEQHAELVAELTAGAELAQILARFALTPEAKQLEDAHWAREFERDPSVRPAWMRAFAVARERLAAAEGAGEKP